MPAIVAHHLFGIETYRALAPVIGEGDVQRDAFLLGNQGPDPLFCLRFQPASVPYRSLGALMHDSDPTALIGAIHRHMVAQPHADDSPLPAFALGFVCHYLLDSIAHPLVYAEQYAFCDAGVEGLTRAQSGSVHALIETDLDEYLLTSRFGLTAKTFVPSRETLTCGTGSLGTVSAHVARASADAYGLHVPALAFAASVRLYRAAQGALDSKREGLRQYVDYGRLAGRRFLHVQALTHAGVPLPYTPFNNGEHMPWPHPFEAGATISASFDELFDAARAKALETLPAFASRTCPEETIERLVNHENFCGKVMEDEVSGRPESPSHSD